MRYDVGRRARVVQSPSSEWTSRLDFLWKCPVLVWRILKMAAC
jgi:hypothetical protein